MVTGRPEKDGDQLIQRIMTFDLLLPGSSQNVNSAALAKLNPTLLGQPAISGADSVCMDVVAPCQLACTRQLLPCFQIITDNPEDDLRRQLIAQRYFAAF